ncbi:MAG: SLC13 family permease [Candidatus Bipolaricaulota bacterium]
MDTQMLATLAVVVVAMLLLLSDRVRPDLIALSVVVVLAGAGVLSSREALSGFSSPAVITILAIFIIAEGLNRTGVTQQVGRLLLRLGGGSEGRLVVAVMVAGAFLSLFMNNIAAAAVLLPAVTGAARRAGVKASRVLMPLAFSTMLGGMATLLTTMNIVVSSILQEHGEPGYGLTDFALVGLPIVAVGVAYMGLWGRRRLPDRSPDEGLWSLPRHEKDLLDVYRLGERLFRARVTPGSYLIGKRIAESTFREVYGLTVVAVERKGKLLTSPLPETVLQEGDVVLLEGDVEDFRRRDREPYLEILPGRPWKEQDLESEATVVVEAMLAPRSSLIGHTLREAHFRYKYGMTALAVWRAEEPIREGLPDVRLEFGDALLLQGPRERLQVLDAEPDLILLSTEKETAPVPRKGKIALAILVGTLALAVVWPMSLGQIMLGGALVMVLAGVLSMDHAYRAVDWRSVFLVAGMLPLSLAMAQSGAAELLADGIVAALDRAGPVVLMAGLFALTALLTQALTGPAVAAVMAPIAIETAAHTGLSVQALGMTVALATSFAFLSPVGHAVNVLVMGAGGYRFRDYARVGWPLAAMLFGVIVLLLPRVWPLV